MTEQTLNVPQLVVFIVLAALTIRWMFSKPAPSAGQPAAANRRAGGARITAAQIDQLTSMFPQHDRRQIAWDLQRNGGNMAATTERILSGRTLDVPPPSFTPPAPQMQAAPAARASAPPSKLSQPDLITRYNLASKLTAAQEDSAPSESKGKQKAWSQDRNERQALLQRRREEMILAARRKLMEKEKGASSPGASS